MAQHCQERSESATWFTRDVPGLQLSFKQTSFFIWVLSKGLWGRCSHRAKHKPLQGIQQDGSFATARAKIYPVATNRPLAIAASRFLTERQLQSSVPQLPMDLQELNNTEMIDGSIAHPDYHRWHACMCQALTNAETAKWQKKMVSCCVHISADHW